MNKFELINIVKEYRYKLMPTHRYASFDYCYNYFKLNSSAQIKNDIEKSCLILGFYLASWGMLRGSSFLIHKSIKHYEAIINYISELDRDIWKIDVDNYNTQNILEIIKIYKEVKHLLIEENNKHLTLVTKILLGVFGFIPAFDLYFCKTFKELYKSKCAFTTVNETSLNYISDFYKIHAKVIDKLSKETFTLDYHTGKITKLNYPKAKIIDMFGFTKSQT